MINIIHKFLHPHCPDCRDEARAKEEIRLSELEINSRNQIEQIRLQNEANEFNHHCDSCDILLRELEIVRSQYAELLNKVINPPIQVEKKPDVTNMHPIQTSKHLSFSARRQILEREDRAKAASARRAQEATTPAKINTTIIGDKESNQTIEELERELNIGEEDA